MLEFDRSTNRSIKFGVYLHILGSLLCIRGNLSFLSLYVLDLLTKQLHAQTFRIRDILWYFRNEATQHFERKNFRSNSTSWARGSTKRSKWKDDGLKSEWILRTFWQIGDNYNIFNLDRISPNPVISAFLAALILSEVFLCPWEYAVEISVVLGLIGVKCIKNRQTFFFIYIDKCRKMFSFIV
jgi:hypothetical protein